MKELSIEEKAARYDEAIEIAKSNYDTIVGMDENCTFAKEGIVNTFHHMFPELKENDGESIRKWLIGYFNQYIIDGMPQVFGNGLKVKDVIAWLEKQGDVDRRIQEEIEKQTKQQWKPEKQGEPKFHVGDWIICCGYAQTQIIDITTNMYKMSNGDIRPFNMVDNNHSIRLWTIQDAKDGDVLVADNSLAFIYNGYLEEQQWPFAYGGINIYGRFNISDGLLPFTHQKVVPATKEQRDLLFSKMKEAGYQWDAEKKELKKIVTPIFKIGDRVRYKEHSCDGVITEITDTDYVCGDAKFPISTQDKLELVEQKSACSEEEVPDETKQECNSIDVSGSIKTNRIEALKNILSYFRYERKTTLEEINISFIPCLENLLKDAENTNGYADWSEDDEEMKILLQPEYEKGKAAVIEAVMNSVIKDKESAIKFLKSAGIIDDNGKLAKEYVADNIEAWSEEDESMLQNILECLKNGWRKLPTDVLKYESWLQSLKDRIQPQSKYEWKQENTDALTDFENVMMHIGISFFGQHAGLNPNDTNAIKEQANILLGLVPKQEWGEEDEEMFDAIIADIQFTQKAHNHEVNQVVYEREIDWLKSIKNRVQPQTQQEWSEEDEKMLHWLCRIVHSQRVGKVITLREESELGEWMDKWLNHNPQNTWKPSDEQIQALEFVVKSLDNMFTANGYMDNYTKSRLEEILEALNKLRGE